ncbi:MAG: hypothetical protein LBJ94_04055 [Puniceicoccales bacterium]|jgi:response regulator RpfG family c-di-GMP phosphodiesterase|nr:hypothetical protein [Puniceicoccales bacterium]
MKVKPVLISENGVNPIACSSFVCESERDLGSFEKISVANGDGTNRGCDPTHSRPLAEWEKQLSSRTVAIAEDGRPRVNPDEVEIAPLPTIQTTGRCTINLGKISKICDLAMEFYKRESLKFDEIRVIYEGEEKFFESFPTQTQQIQILEEGACEYSGEKVAELKKELDLERNLFLWDARFQDRIRALISTNKFTANHCRYSNFDCRLKRNRMAEMAVTVIAIARHLGELFEEFRDVSSEEVEDAMIAVFFHDLGQRKNGANAHNILRALAGDLLSEERIERILDAIVRKNNDVGYKSRAAILLHDVHALSLAYPERNFPMPGTDQNCSLDLIFSDACSRGCTLKNPSFNFTLMDGVTPGDAQSKIALLACKSFEFSRENHLLNCQHSEGTFARILQNAKKFHMFDAKYGCNEQRIQRIIDSKKSCGTNIAGLADGILPREEQIRKITQVLKLDGIDFSKIFQIYDLAAQFYRKDFPKFDEIRVIYEGEEKFLKDLTQIQQVEMLEKGVRGRDSEMVAKLKEMLNSENSLPEEQFTKMVRGLLDVHEGTSKSHNEDHMVQVALIIISVAIHLGKLFEEFRNISNEEIEDAIIAAFFHDSGRQGDGIDIFDEISAKNARGTLALPLSEERIKRISDAIINKDANPRGKDIVAILLHEADFLNYGRLGTLNAKFSDFYNPDYTEENPVFAFTLRDGVTPKQAQTEITSLLWKSFSFAKQWHEISYTPPTPLLYQHFENAEAKHMFDTEYVHFDHKRKRVDVPSRGKMQLVDADTIQEFLSKNSYLDLFLHDNIFEISEAFLSNFSGIERAISGDAGENIDSGRETFDWKFEDPADERRFFMEIPIEKVKEAMLFCQTLRLDGWSEKMVQRVAYYRLKFEQCEIFEDYKRNRININEVDTLLKKSTPAELALHISEMGGSWVFLECLLASQVASSWSALSVAVKQWLIGQRATPEDFRVFFHDDRQGDTSKPVSKVRKNDMSIFATFRKSRDFGGEKGRNEMLANFSRQPESFWIDTAFKVARAEFRMPYVVVKEQVRIDTLCDLIERVEANVNSGNLAGARECLPEIQVTLRRMQKTKGHTEDKIQEIIATDESDDDLDDLADVYVSNFKETVKSFSDVDGKVKKMNSLLREENSADIDGIKECVADSKAASAALREQICYMVDSAAEDCEARFYVLDALDVLARTTPKEVDPADEDNQFSPFDETLYMLYAFTQSLLSRLAFGGDEGDNSHTPIALSRRCDDTYIDSCFQYDGKNRSADGTFKIPDNTEGTIVDSAAYESFSIRPIPSEDSDLFGNHLLKMYAPLHRIFFPVFIGSEIANLMGSPSDIWEEMATISRGCKARYVSQHSEAPNAPSESVE